LSREGSLSCHTYWDTGPRFSGLLRHEWGCRGSILTRILTGQKINVFDWLFTVLRPAQEFFTYMETSPLPLKVGGSYEFSSFLIFYYFLCTIKDQTLTKTKHFVSSKYSIWKESYRILKSAF
jgi:hypothetical protein